MERDAKKLAELERDAKNLRAAKAEKAEKKRLRKLPKFGPQKKPEGAKLAKEILASNATIDLATANSADINKLMGDCGRKDWIPGTERNKKIDECRAAIEK